MLTRTIFFIISIVFFVVGFSILGFELNELSIQAILGMALILTAGQYTSKAFDKEYFSFRSLKEEKFFEIKSAVGEKEYFFYQVLQDGEMTHIRDVRKFAEGTYIRSGKEITLRTGH